MKRLPLLFAAAALVPVALLGFSDAAPREPFDGARAAIAVRKVGHELLRAHGDSSSPLPPLAEPAPGTYVLSFPSAFRFRPDSLVALIDGTLKRHLPGTDYIVNVAEAPGQASVFGYAMLASGRDAIVPCLGRDQPARRYTLSIQFRQAAPFWNTGRLLGAGASVLALGLLVVWAKRRRNPAETVAAETALPATEPAASESTVPETITAEGLALGSYRFLPAQQCLLFDGERIPLTGKECSLLQLFAARPNEVIGRAELQKIWEDEGVIVGRSLDVFVSRLRKKLERDASLTLVGITGKGYKLETGNVPSIPTKQDES